MNDHMADYHTKSKQYFKNPRPEMLKFIPETATRILEIGCGDGSFGATVKHLHPVHYTGVDIFEKSIAAASSNIDQVVLANIDNDELPFAHNQFDCLIMNDVLEHLIDPWHALEELLTYLAPNGHVVASIPNMRHYPVIKDLLINGQWQYKEDGVMDRTHLRFFTRRTIENLFQSNNLKTILLQGINGGHFPWKFDLLNKILLNSLDDMRYRQFAYVGIKDSQT